MNRLTKFRRLSGMERRLLIEAVFWLGTARVAISLLPFRRIAPYLGEHMAQTPEETDPRALGVIRGVAWGVATASRHLPWECKCLARAVTGKQMLRRRGVPSTLYLGLAKDETEKLEAHAWLRSGEIIITGYQEMDRYTVVSTFA
ncbi:MAG: lasso peptide biosynthesis B2 protein [Proteobacteria bacterium]|nr:lasso peptide biosynthesis B2 protein [Pseudomonadota bacterium]MBU1741410.1 lasso peptide biosynthesis B2 protein [Pseudomonadota bacterium]